MSVVVADGRHPPLRSGSCDVVLVDAPCSGLGTLRRRADARWRIEPEAVQRLVGLQRTLLDSACDLLRPGGQLVYSVCTLTAAETLEVAEHASGDARLAPEPPPQSPWVQHGGGGLLVPDADHDGMAVYRWRRR